jgi:hypothetical protein
MSLEETDYVNRITLELMVNKSRLKNYIEVDDTNQTQDLDILENQELILEVTKELILINDNELITEKYSREMIHTFQKYAILCIKSKDNS